MVDGLTRGGLDVVRIGMGPSPMLYFAAATLHVDGGIQVTGSHNPADYNGFKMVMAGRAIRRGYRPGIAQLYRLASNPLQPVSCCYLIA